SAPAKLVRRFEGVNEWPTYSPDGTRLSYVSARGTVARAQNRRDTLCILDLKTARTKDFVTDFRQIYNPLWLSRNSGLIVPAQKRSEDIGLYLFDIETGRFTLIVQFRYGDLLHHDVAPDGKTLYYARRDKEKDVTEFVARDLDTGTERLLHTVTPSEWIRTALSPDGTQLAYINRAEDRVIRVIPTSGGEPRDAVRYRHIGNHLVQFTWSADGKYFLVPRIDNPPPPASGWSLWRFRVSDGQGEKILSNCGRATKTTVHPDGQRIAFASPGAGPQNAELWVVEHYLPENGK
ncbi:MAG TPA: WD40 repeat domain-containing protein, partial [Bryobacteraceae bacterium]|nr:WD40 repeat domain-containing protein [Bryobacteraceae bacterium]